MPFAANLQSLLGLLILTGLAALLAPRGTERASRLLLKTSVAGLLVQLIAALIILKLPPVRYVFTWLNEAVAALQVATDAGILPIRFTPTPTRARMGANRI